MLSGVLAAPRAVLNVTPWMSQMLAIQNAFVPILWRPDVADQPSSCYHKNFIMPLVWRSFSVILADQAEQLLCDSD